MKLFFLKVSYNQKVELNCAHFTEWAALQKGSKVSVLSRFVRDQLLNLKNVTPPGYVARLQTLGFPGGVWVGHSVSEYVIGSALGRHGRDTVGLEGEQRSVRMWALLSSHGLPMCHAEALCGVAQQRMSIVWVESWVGQTEGSRQEAGSVSRG